MRNTCQVSNTEFVLVNTERFIVCVMSLSRLHKLNITLRPHNLDCLRIGVQPDSRGCLQFWLTETTDSRSVHPYELDWTNNCTRRRKKNNDSPHKYCFAFLMILVSSTDT